MFSCFLGFFPQPILGWCVRKGWLSVCFSSSYICISDYGATIVSRFSVRFLNGGSFFSSNSFFFGLATLTPMLRLFLFEVFWMDTGPAVDGVHIFEKSYSNSCFASTCAFFSTLTSIFSFFFFFPTERRGAGIISFGDSNDASTLGSELN